MQLKQTARPFGQNRDAFTQAFAVPNSDVAVPEIDILHSQADTLHQAQPASVKQLGHQSIFAHEVIQNRPGFFAGEDDRNLGWAFDPRYLINEIEFSLQYLLIEEEQCAERLVLRRSGDISIYCEMSEEFGDFLLAHFVWVAFAMKENVTANPIDVRLLGADGVMFHPQMPANAIE